MLTQAEVQAAVPANLKVTVSQDLVDTLNKICTDEEVARTVRENLVSYTHVMREGKFKFEDYIHAVSYVSFQLMGYNNQESYARTFPDRYQALIARGATAKDISAYVAAYHKNKLVNMIMEQSMIPMWLLNQTYYQEAINKQVNLMRTSKRDDVVQKAADSLMNHLKKPEPKGGIELNLNLGESTGIKDLKDQLAQLAQAQKELISAGMKTRDIAHMSIVDAEVVPEEPQP